MIRYALIYGTIAGTIVISVISAGIALDRPNHTTSEWFGYLVMLLALSLIFVGVKRFRDVECGGVIGFGRALGLGLAIAIVAALIYIVGMKAGFKQPTTVLGDESGDATDDADLIGT